MSTAKPKPKPKPTVKTPSQKSIQQMGSYYNGSDVRKRNEQIKTLKFNIAQTQRQWRHDASLSNYKSTGDTYYKNRIDSLKQKLKAAQSRQPMW